MNKPMANGVTVRRERVKLVDIKLGYTKIIIIYVRIHKKRSFTEHKLFRFLKLFGMLSPSSITGLS